MKKIIAWPITWLFFWMGDLISRIMHYFDWGLLYPVYNKLMWWSVEIQEWANVKGPWKEPNGRRT